MHVGFVREEHVKTVNSRRGLNCASAETRESKDRSARKRTARKYDCARVSIASRLRLDDELMARQKRLALIEYRVYTKRTIITQALSRKRALTLRLSKVCFCGKIDISFESPRPSDTPVNSFFIFPRQFARVPAAHASADISRRRTQRQPEAR